MIEAYSIYCSTRARANKGFADSRFYVAPFWDGSFGVEPPSSPGSRVTGEGPESARSGHPAPPARTSVVAPKQTFPAADHGAADPFRGQAQITEITANRAARAYPDG